MKQVMAVARRSHRQRVAGSTLPIWYSSQPTPNGFYGSATSLVAATSCSLRIHSFSTQPALETLDAPSPSLLVQQEPEPDQTKRKSLKHRPAKKRRAAAQTLPYCLTKDPAWRERTMQLLQLPTGDSKNNNNNNNAAAAAQQTVLHECRQVYFDSLPSFTELITSPNPPTAMHAALDRLVAAGFAQTDFSRDHRRMRSFRYHHGKQTAAILERKATLRTRTIRRDAVAAEVKKLQEKLAGLPVTDNETVDSSTAANGSSLWQRAVSTIGSLLQPESKQDLQRAIRRNRNLEKKRCDLDRKIRNRKRSWEEHCAAVQKVHEGLKRVQAEKEAFQPPLSKADYARANEAIVEVMDDVCKALAVHIQDRHSHLLEQYQTLDAKTDLTKPQEWFPYARLDRRKIIYHGGPTNSGKTYQALERLKQAKKGMYVGPLRLLAAEVYEKLTADGIYCNLYTGQDQREIPFATHGAATIEMASIYDEFDIIVIDEIQMMADDERGFGWTRALLGSRCKEIHVCGGLEAKDMVQRLVEACGDEFELKMYERFSPLTVADTSLAHSPDQIGSYSAVRPGDCVVAFSRNDIFAIAREIENTTKYKCCVIYGSLPPQTRSEQARRFNDPDSGYDIAVATDCIGLGLNLNIRRIVFNSIFKHNGSGITRLDHSAIKQISGRAGRRNSPYPDGLVTCRSPDDMPYLRRCMETEIETIQKVGLLPTAGHIEEFSNALEKYGIGHGVNSLHKVLHQFSDMATVKSDFFLCRQTSMYTIAKYLEKRTLSIRDKYTLCMCPVIINSDQSLDVLKRFAEKLSQGGVSGLTRSMVSFDADLKNECNLEAPTHLLFLSHHALPRRRVGQRTLMTCPDYAVSTTNSSSSCGCKRSFRLAILWRSKRLLRVKSKRLRTSVKVWRTHTSSS